MWFAIANILATLTLERARDADGHELPLEEEIEWGFLRSVTLCICARVDDAFNIVSGPKAFACRASPRSRAAFALYRQAAESYA